MPWSLFDLICGSKSARRSESEQAGVSAVSATPNIEGPLRGSNKLTLDDLIAAVKEFNVPKFLACKDAKLNIYLHNTDKLDGTLLHAVVRQAAAKPEKTKDAVNMYLAICNAFDPERLEEMKRTPDLQDKRAMEYSTSEFMVKLKELMQTEKRERERSKRESSSSKDEHKEVTETKVAIQRRDSLRYMGSRYSSGGAGSDGTDKRPNSNVSQQQL